MEKRIIEICWITLVALLALILPYVFVPIMFGMLIAQTESDSKEKGK